MLQTDSSLPVNLHSLILESMCPILSFLFDLSGSCAKNTSITTIVYGSESLSASKRTEWGFVSSLSVLLIGFQKAHVLNTSFVLFAGLFWWYWFLCTSCDVNSIFTGKEMLLYKECDAFFFVAILLDQTCACVCVFHNYSGCNIIRWPSHF